MRRGLWAHGSGALRFRLRARQSRGFGLEESPDTAEQGAG